MNLIDLHCDTLFLMEREGGHQLEENTLCVDLKKMKCANSMAQFFACFIYMNDFAGENRYTDAYMHALKLIERGQQEFAMNKDVISLACSYEDLLQNHREGKMSAVLTIEEGGIIEDDMARLEHLYEQGIRLMTLLWNGENCMGYPNSRDRNVMEKGLKTFGIETVERMNEMGMMIDVSHLSDGGFGDVIRYSKKPVVASHSNARMLCNHPRNLTDDMIKALAEHGGIAGINFYPAFLNGTAKSGIDDLIRHIEHMYHVGGEEFVAMGTDFDGFDDSISKIGHIGEMPQLYDALKKRKFNDSQIERFWNKNALRVIKEVLK